MKARIITCALAGAWTVLPLVGCLSVKTEHEIKPIEININVNVKVDKELNNFFDDLDAKDKTLDAKPAGAGK